MKTSGESAIDSPSPRVHPPAMANIGERASLTILHEKSFGLFLDGGELGVVLRLFQEGEAGVDGGIAADQDQPGGGIAGRAVLRPALQRAQAGFLEGFLGGIESPEVAQQRPHHPGAGCAGFIRFPTTARNRRSCA